MLRSAALCSLACLAACADGGEEKRPTSEVKVSATHHLFGFRSLAGFGSLPVRPEVVFTDRGKLTMGDDSRYTITRASGTSSPDSYALSAKGELGIYVTGSGREPSVVFRGGYARTGQVPDFFFTDRVRTENSPSLGLYVGSRVIQGQAELAGAWHVASLHVVFGQALLSPSNVGRGAFGAVTVATGDPGTARAISGTGTEGTATVTFGGTIRNLLDGNNQGDGSCDLTLSYQLPGLAADSRVMFAAAGRNVVFGLDADETDGEAGLVCMVRKFDAPATPVESVRVPGRFVVGGHTLFVNPSNAGSDAFYGVVTLTNQGGFRLEAIGNNGQDFAYSGTYTLSQDGSMTIQVNGTNEQWSAAIDRDYQTFVLVDGTVETRSNNTPELNFLVGVRERTD